MGLRVQCIYCLRILEEPGALILGPPDTLGRVEKLHVCRACYYHQPPQNELVSKSGEVRSKIESWLDTYRRKHPWRWRWMLLCDRVQRAWDWVWDASYWHMEDDDLVLRGLRSGEPREEQCSDIVE